MQVEPPFFRPGFFERWAFRKKHKLLHEIDAGIDSASLDKATALSRDAFFLQVVQYSPELIPQIGSHHLSLLNKLIMIAELQQKNLSNLALLEGLLDARAQLMKHLCERNLKSKQGQKDPDWARKERQAKLGEIWDKLETNSQSIEKQMSILFEHLLRSEDRSVDIQYH